MPQTTSNLSNSLRTQYIETYKDAADFEKLYDQFAAPVGKDMAQLEKGTAVQVPFLSDMTPGVTAISQTTDVTPQQLRDAVATITPTSRGEALQWSQQLDIQTYTDYADQRLKALGKNMQESIELLALVAGLQGGLLNRATSTRAGLDAGTAGHRLTDIVMSEIETWLMTLKCPPMLMPGGGERKWIGLMPPAVYHDLRQATNILAVGQYQKERIVLNFELGEVGPFKLIVSPWAKVFGSAGAANASVVATTIAASATANRQLDKQIEVASATNITSGDFLTIGTVETGNTFFPTNERVRVSSAYVSGTTIDIIGEGANGGLRFDHAVAQTVSNADSVFPVLFGGPMSLAKVYATEVGEYGKMGDPQVNGLLDQFQSIGWKYFGGYGRWSESYVLRGEYSTSLEN